MCKMWWWCEFQLDDWGLCALVEDVLFLATKLSVEKDDSLD